MKHYRNNKIRYGMAASLVAACMLTGTAAVSASGTVYNPLDFGALADGKTLSTAAIQQTIDRCAAAGGGVVEFSAGRYLTGTVYLKSNITLKLNKNAVLLGSLNLKDYPVTVPAYRSFTDTYTVRSLIYGEKLHNIRIVGKGVIDGQGGGFHGSTKVRPYGIRLIECGDVRIENVTLKNAAMWMLHLLACDDVTVSGVTVNSLRNHNNDGIDIDGSHRVLIENCSIESGDDSIVLKSTSARAAEDVTVKNCRLSSRCNAIKLGTESCGGFKRIKISNCSVGYGKSRGGRKTTGRTGIAVLLVDGGVMDDISISHIDIKGVAMPIFIRLANRARRFKPDMPKPGMGIMRNVTLSDIHAAEVGNLGCGVAGITNHPIENLTLRNITLEFPGGVGARAGVRRFKENPAGYPRYSIFGRAVPAYGFYFWHVKGLVMENIKITTKTPDRRSMVVFEDVTGISIDGVDINGPADLPAGYRKQ